LISAKVGATCLALLASATADSVIAAASAPDVYPFIAAIAKVTAGAQIQGDQRFEKVVTFGRNASGELVVTTLEALNVGQRPQLPSGTLGVMIVHYQGQCGPPLASDDYAASQGLLDFVVSSTGEDIWEVTASDGASEVRSVEGPGRFGPWEKFQTDPSRYRSYACGA
jgi:hypothetical protein